METEPELTARTTPAVPVQSGSQAGSLFAGISGVVDGDLLRSHAAALAATFAGTHLTVVYPGADTSRTSLADGVELMSYPLPTAEGTTSPWAHTAAAQSALLALAADAQAKALVILHPDLTALEPAMLTQLASPVLAGQADLIMASYTQGAFDGLLNQSVLAPLTRALYGKRIRFPLAPDFAVSHRLALRLAMSSHAGNAGAVTPVLWPTTIAASMDASVFEARLPLHHPTPAGDLELSTVIAQLVGSTFSEMELHAPLWQRVRSASPAAPVRSAAAADEAASVAAEAAEIDRAPMIKSFLLGSRSLQDVWGTVLPPVTLLDLKRLTLMTPEKFRMPDELWVRIIYDFALGYRLRTINRAHLMGALTPLYLGWVASYINEAATDPAFNAETRGERLARAFEDGKPYLVRRWRWPDRFNP